jgi:hypothetical protein
METGDRIKCTKDVIMDDGSIPVTEGTTYIVKEVWDDEFSIINNEGEEHWFDIGSFFTKNHFDIIENNGLDFDIL